MDLVWRGFMIGFAVAIPFGPMGLLCLRRMLVDGRRAGIVSGLGMATADTVYGALAALSLAAVESFLTREEFWLHLVGGLALLGIGIKTFLEKPIVREVPISGTGLVGIYLSTFTLTVINPGNILLFAAIFAGWGVSIHAFWPLLALLVGMYLGSAIWWFVVAGLVSLFHAHLGPNTLQRINQMAGIALVGFGLITLFFPEL